MSNYLGKSKHFTAETVRIITNIIFWDGCFLLEKLLTLERNHYKIENRIDVILIILFEVEKFVAGGNVVLMKEKIETDDMKMQQVYKQVIEIGKKHGVQKIVLFGSRARKDNHEKSDIDLAIYECKDFGLFQEEIEEHVWTLLKFDLIDMNVSNRSIELVNEIERDGVVLYEKV